ncbi:MULTISPECIES: hypothetical protein [unclassified Bradyrhizobium]|uniref:hypothetical protein n=1 Tax=unclassified Bradyrhizobium TaxID=2631580 RepID=UPI0024E14D17|nr:MULTISPECIES: hypothetical protein [unclassified Bradyrhizobium]
MAAALAILIGLAWFVGPPQTAVTCTRGSTAGLTTGCEPAPRALTFEDIIPTTIPPGPPTPGPRRLPNPVMSALPETAARR